MSARKLTPSDFIVRRLNEKIDITGFDCCLDDGLGLNEFLHKEALDYQKEAMGITHLFYHEDKIVGYVTIAMGSISVKSTNLKLKFFDNKVRYPALLLGRVAVDNNFRRMNVGRCMCKWALGFAIKHSQKIGCRFIVLSTKDESRIAFYKRCGFEICPEKPNKKKLNVNELQLMYLQIF